MLLPWDGHVALPAVSVSRELLLNMLAMATSGQLDKSMNASLTNFIHSNGTFLASVVTCE